MQETGVSFTKIASIGPLHVILSLTSTTDFSSQYKGTNWYFASTNDIFLHIFNETILSSLSLLNTDDKNS